MGRRRVTWWAVGVVGIVLAATAAALLLSAALHGREVTTLSGLHLVAPRSFDVQGFGEWAEQR